MKFEELKTARKKFRGTQDKNFVDRIYKIIQSFNAQKIAPTTRQISNVYYKVQSIDEAILNTDMSQPTNVQDSILQSVLNPLVSRKKLLPFYEQRNQKCFVIPEIYSKWTNELVKGHK